MTENEAIGRLRDHFRIHNDDRPTPYLDEAVSMAIKAFEEIKAYRELGTVDDLKDLLIVISEGQDDVDESGVSVGLLDNLLEYAKYARLGTVEEFKILKEKNVAKKPIRSDLCTCPSCGTHNEIIKKRRNTVTFDTVYCWHCGQAIEVKRDWQWKEQE